jgi:hypothetical protein
VSFLAALKDSAVSTDEKVAFQGFATAVQAAATAQQETVDAAQGFFCEINEEAQAEDAAQGGGLIVISYTEEVTASDEAVGVNLLNASVIASAEVDETLAARVDFVASVEHGAQAIDQDAAQMAFVASLTEAAQSSDSIPARLLWEPILVNQDPNWRKIVNTPS